MDIEMLIPLSRLKGQRVIPQRLIESGFIFKHPDIEEAMEAIIGQMKRDTYLALQGQRGLI
jgi:hypothetical protein